MKARVAFLIVALAFSYAESWSRTIAPSAVEVDIRYEAQFLINRNDPDVVKNVRYHSSHLFGLLQADQLVADVSLDPLWIDGIGSPSWPLKYSMISAHPMNEGKVLVTYQADGRLLIHRKAYRLWSGRGLLKIPMPYDLTKFYEERVFSNFKSCVDEPYADPPNFPYFYDWSRPRCQALREMPLAKDVTVLLGDSFDGYEDWAPRNVPIRQVQGDNGNGGAMTVYIAHGFDESAIRRRDEGRAVFHRLDRVLTESLLFSRRTYERGRFTTFIEYTRRVGERDVIVRSLLVNTDNDKNRKTFPRFWKEAIENGDIVIYGGHSSEGVGPDLDRIQEILWEEDRTKIRFSTEKYQIYFFDACWSYSYYVDQYRGLLRQGVSPMISYGLPSYYPYAHEVLKVLLETLTINNEAQTWSALLGKMENALQGDNYLINVNL